MKNTFVLTQLPLNICYRCPENVIRLARDIVPEIEWNKDREDKGIVKFVKLADVMEQIKPQEVIIGRKNKDLVKIYRKFVLDLKKPVKFKNKELVSSLANNINQVIAEYIKLYTRGVNIQKPLKKHMEEWSSKTQQLEGTDLYNQELQSYSKELISNNSGKSSRKTMSFKSIKALETCMEEYKNLGAYGIREDDQLTEFYDIIKDFLSDFRKDNKSELIDDFKDYIKAFLSSSAYADVPIIGSVHSMKGSEADTVYIYNYPLFPYKIGNNVSEDDYQQEKNLKYVAITRAKKNLYLILCEEKDKKYADANMKALLDVNLLLGNL